MKIGIIIGSIREGRLGAAVGDWALTRAATRTDAEYVRLDLADFDLPLLTSPTVPGAANRRYDDARVTAWGETIDACDGFVFVTPEYNHSVPGAFKNAVDSIYPEWADKAVGFVGYGADGAVRAVEHWRGIVANLHMTDIRAQLALSLHHDVTDGAFTPSERRVRELDSLLDALVAATAKLRG